MSESRKVWVMVRGYSNHGKWWPYAKDVARVTEDGFQASLLVLSAIERSELNWFTFLVEERDGACTVEPIDPTTGRPWAEDGLYRSLQINQLKDAAANAGWAVLSGQYKGKEVYHVI